MPQGLWRHWVLRFVRVLRTERRKYWYYYERYFFLKYSCDPGWIFFLIKNQRIQRYGTWFRGYGRMYRRQKPACFPWSCSSCPRIVFCREKAVRVVLFPASLAMGRSPLPLEVPVHSAFCNSSTQTQQSASLLFFGDFAEFQLWAWLSMSISCPLVIINSAVVSNVVCIALAMSYLSLGLETCATVVTLLIFSHWFVELFRYWGTCSFLWHSIASIDSICPLNFYFV